MLQIFVFQQTHHRMWSKKGRRFGWYGWTQIKKYIKKEEDEEE